MQKRVSRLLKSITLKDPSILLIVTHIQGNMVMRNDFERISAVKTLDNGGSAAIQISPKTILGLNSIIKRKTNIKS